MSKVKKYDQMTLLEVKELDRAKTIFLIAVSPLETHGPHLPFGTDVVVAEELQKRYIRELEKEYPDYSLIILPSLYIGSDALPYEGSLSVPASLLKGVLLSYVKGLANQGFKYLFISDNHGGPRHQLAIESASRKAWKKYKFYLVDPFGLVFKYMVENEESFLKETGLISGQCGDDPDSHAGTNETSLMLAIDETCVSSNIYEIPASPIPSPSRPIIMLSKLIGMLSPKLKRELHHLANTLGWVTDKNMFPYMGNPSLATKEAGEKMLNARVNIAMKLFRKALSGELVNIDPLLWKLRILQYLPE